jgi:hypothetical protein
VRLFNKKQDGKNNKGPKPKAEALKLKLSGATIIVVGIGSGVSLSELRMIASANYVFTPAQFNQLYSLLRQIVPLLCRCMLLNCSFPLKIIT